MGAPPPPTPGPAHGGHLPLDRSIAQKARLAAFLLVGLLLVTTVCYTIYVAEGISGYTNVVNRTPAGQSVYQNQTANTSAGPLLALSPGGLKGLMLIGGFSVVGLVWIMVILTLLTVMRPSNLRNPGKLLDVFYMNMLFGFVFWPLAAIGALIPASDSVVMLATGFLPALVITRFLAQFVEEGTGNKILFVVILGAIGVLMTCNGIAWSGFLSGSDLGLVVGLQVLPVGVFLLLAILDKNDPLRSRPLVGEIFLWSAIGMILSAAAGMAASASFGGVSAEIAVATGLFQGFTPVIAPFTASSYATLSGLGTTTSVTLPALFGILGILSAFICLVPLLLVGDLYLLRIGLENISTCSRCHRTFLALKVQDAPLCNRCRGHAVRPTPTHPEQVGPQAPPPGFAPSA